MLDLARDPLVRFVGYGVRYGGQAAGTLRGIPEEQLIETPVAENLMVGLAIGLALQGLRPVVFIERCDFILNAMDAIVNHLDKVAEISRGEFQPAMILRVVVGNRRKPLYTGPTHTQDFSGLIGEMVSFPVVRLESSHAVSYRHRIPEEYQLAYHLMKDPVAPLSTMLVEYKDLYEFPTWDPFIAPRAGDHPEIKDLKDIRDTN